VLGGQRGVLADAIQHLGTSRPTAANLFWALNRMKSLGTEDPDRLLAEARAIHAEDAAMCDAIGQHTIQLIPSGAGILTHCNAGALATGGIGTATAGFYTAHARSIPFRVYSCETRPLLQGARLTAWELSRAGIDVTLICDSASASLMREGKVQLVITGADRIAANGDTANKIGTYALAVLAHHHRIPFYVAAPQSTFDLACPDGSAIPIERRDAAEILPAGATGFLAENPAFDVTPARLIRGIVTDCGIVEPVDASTIRKTLHGTARG